ncbi:hypothetical protein CHS0354_007517 [Potamilus streckersoni]|uniref:Uncharacterized protein n=1 Tax=Potamilus streckersoni TaxID=2493646 RepID=A0AAE0T7T2_9BIVA|nr:hypothetical protein CHS0354_007517 [Potamilus streckersoni]
MNVLLRDGHITPKKINETLDRILAAHVREVDLSSKTQPPTAVQLPAPRWPKPQPNPSKGFPAIPFLISSSSTPFSDQQKHHSYVIPSPYRDKERRAELRTIYDHVFIVVLKMMNHDATLSPLMYAVMSTVTSRL